MGALKCLFVAILLLTAAISQANSIVVGVVLMHGKTGMPGDKPLAAITDRLRGEGFAVATPQMPWSRLRIYDATVEQAMLEIEVEVAKLRERGATRIIVGGHSMGANAAIRYAATHMVDGLFALAPGHSPEKFKKSANDVMRARQMVTDGKGSEKAYFYDSNGGREFSTYARADVYLSWFDPHGLAVMPLNAAAIKIPLPLFFAVGDNDPATRPQSYIFDKAAAHPKSLFMTYDTDHIGVLQAATKDLIAWLKQL